MQKRINDPTKKLTKTKIGWILHVVKEKVYNEVGGFSEEYKIGNFEDDDLSLKIRHAGYSLMVIDESVLIHHFGSMSFKKQNQL